MAQAEQMIRKAESLPTALFEEVDHYIDYLTQKAHAAYVAEKLAEAKKEMAKPDVKWLTEEEFWEDDEENEIYQKLIEAQAEAQTTAVRLSHKEVFDPLRQKINNYI